MDKIAFFNISFYSLNLLSAMIGMAIGAMFWRAKSAALIVALYFAGLAGWYYYQYECSVAPDAVYVIHSGIAK